MNIILILALFVSLSTALCDNDSFSLVNYAEPGTVIDFYSVAAKTLFADALLVDHRRTVEDFWDQLNNLTTHLDDLSNAYAALRVEHDKLLAQYQTVQQKMANEEEEEEAARTVLLFDSVVACLPLICIVFMISVCYADYSHRKRVRLYLASQSIHEAQAEEKEEDEEEEEEDEDEEEEEEEDEPPARRIPASCASHTARGAVRP